MIYSAVVEEWCAGHLAAVVEADRRVRALMVQKLLNLMMKRTTLTGLVDCDTFHDTPVNFPARWHDTAFNGVLPKGTPVAQCLPIRREGWIGRFERISADENERMIQAREAIGQETDVYRRRFRAPKR